MDSSITKNCSTANAVTLARQADPVRRQVRTLISRINHQSRTHLHKAIASRAKARYTAQRLKLGIRATRVVNGMKILMFMGSEDRGGRAKNLRDSPLSVKATETSDERFRKKGEID